jgi:small subunit ribosomal protein S18
MQEHYELYLILSPELTSQQVNKQVDTIKKLIEKSVNSKEIKTDLEGLKKLAYPINKHQTGFYVLFEYSIDFEDAVNNNQIEAKLNLNDKVVRYILVNQTEYLKAKSHETPRKEPEFSSHREMNKGSRKKGCISKYLGLKAIDYKDVDFLSQFTSPYAKIFSRDRTGSSAKYQRKITRAIKRARHMALMPFTPNHND